MKLTQKQENFCLKYVECGKAAEAYRHAYSAENMKPETVHKRASELLDDGEVSGRIEQLKEEHRARHRVTVDDLLEELEEARMLAMSVENAAPAVSATMGKAKILGLDKQVIDHTSSDGTMTPKAPMYKITDE